MQHLASKHLVIIAHRNKLTCARDGIHLQVLFVASSNAAVDKILLQLHRDRIPDRKGGCIDPQVVRIARQN